jgi:hypothetical protein
MKQRFSVVAALAAVVLGACGDAPTEVTEGTVETAAGEMVITEGVAAPTAAAVFRPSSAAAVPEPHVGGSATSALSLLALSCGSNSQTLSVTYRLTGQQNAPGGAFQVNTRWEYSGSGWAGSLPATVAIPTRSASNDPTFVTRTFTIVNNSETSTGLTQFTIPAFNGTGSPTPQLVAAGVVVHVEFSGCAPPNTPPTLVFPDDITVEASSAAGAVVTYAVSATDLEDGDLTSSVVCTPASGATFELGTTTVNCSVTDDANETTQGSFTVTVEDTTPAYFTSIPSGTLTAIAANAAGAVIDIDTFNITVADVGNVSEPSTFACNYVAGTVLAIGSTTTVSCTATDAIGNESVASTFNVFVGLNVAGSGFLPPLRNDAPFSAHKRGSTIPHKFLPPTYADGTPATDLASGLKLVIKLIGSDLPGIEVDESEYSSGSTDWRYDAVDGHYIFNLKSQTAWQLGAWQTTVSFAGITLAQTEFVLKK